MHFVIAAQIRHQATDEQVGAAMDSACGVHPLLGSVITGGFRRAVFDFGVGARWSVRVIRMPAAGDYADIVPLAEAMMHSALQQEAMLAVHRVIGREAADWFLFCFHHAVADARSGVQLVRQFTAQLAAPKNPGTAIVAECNSLSPYLPDLATGWKGFHRTWRLLTTQRRAAKAYGKALQVSNRGSVHPRQWTTRLLTRTLPAPLSLSFFSACRTRGVTVHAALAGLSAVSILRVLGMNSGRVVVQSPIDIRGDLRLYPAEAIGMLASALPMSAVVSGGDDVWAVAADMGRTLREAKTKATHVALYNSLSSAYVLNGGWWVSADRFAANASLRNGSTLALSNLGQVPGPGAFEGAAIERLTFFISPSTVELALTASTMSDSLTLNVCYADPLVSRELAEAFLGRLIDALEQGLEPPNTCPVETI